MDGLEGFWLLLSDEAGLEGLDRSSGTSEGSIEASTDWGSLSWSIKATGLGTIDGAPSCSKSILAMDDFLTSSIGTILIYNILKSHLNMMIVTSVNMVMVDDDGWNVALCKSRASVWSMKREVKAAALHETS